MTSHRTPPQWLGSCVLLVLAMLHVSRTAAASDGTIDADLYGQLLEAHTRSVPEIVGTRVDYRALKESPDWKRLVRQVHAARPSLMKRDEATAFWINAYNILAIELVCDHYPIDGIKQIGSFFSPIHGIKQIGSFFSPVWDLEVATIEGRTISLGGIEHQILRKRGEPRIHAAIVCASVSCPPLARTPFRSESLDADLSAAMRSWLSNDEKGFLIDRERHIIRLSKIFDWFEKDFRSKGGVLQAISPYLAEDDAAWIRSEGENALIRYFDYDWSLNN